LFCDSCVVVVVVPSVCLAVILRETLTHFRWFLTAVKILAWYRRVCRRFDWLRMFVGHCCWYCFCCLDTLSHCRW